jgi:predicted  nucleic acid-binding Zn-ribbon protein
MQLHVARLCLDCDEIHEEQSCPICGSASFGYISRWIPASERRKRPRPVIASPTAATYRELLAPDQARPDKSRWLRRGVIGVTAVSVAGWILRRKLAQNRRETKPGGEVKG